MLLQFYQFPDSNIQSLFSFIFLYLFIIYYCCGFEPHHWRNGNDIPIQPQKFVLFDRRCIHPKVDLFNELKFFILIVHLTTSPDLRRDLGLVLHM